MKMAVLTQKAIETGIDDSLGKMEYSIIIKYCVF